MAATIIAPTVHLNGSSADVLKEQLCDVTGALRRALLKMDEARPNARDYYVQDGGTFRAVQDQHVDRCTRVRAVLAEYQGILDELQDQIDARDERRGRR